MMALTCNYFDFCMSVCRIVQSCVSSLMDTVIVICLFGNCIFNKNIWPVPDM